MARDGPKLAAVTAYALDERAAPWALLDVDCGHVVPALALVNGARARVTVAGDRAAIKQSLV